MKDELPNPLTPADCELQDFPFMPLDVGRLRDSDLGSNVPHAQCWYAVLLWCASWHQVPAASLPDNDQTLAKLAGFGHFVKEWKKVRAGALYGWIKCSDGRLYHPVVAEKAIDAWKAKLEQRWKTECARIKKHNQRHDPGLPYPTLEEFLAQRTTVIVPRDKSMAPGESPGGRPGVVPDESGSKGQGQGQGQGQGEVNPEGTVIAGGNPPRGGRDDFTPKNEGDWQRYFRERHGVELDATSVHDRKKAWPLFSAWCKRGITVAQMDAAVAKAYDEATETIAFLPAYVDRVLASASRPAPQPRLTPDEQRLAISEANAAAWLASGSESDPTIIDMEH